MDYFFMKTDKRICRLPKLQLSEELLRLKQENIKHGSITSMVYIKGNSGLITEYADYYETPIPLIGERFQKIAQKYQPDAVFHRVILVEKQTGEQRPYYLLLPPEIECADKGESIYDDAGNIEKFVLEEEKVGRQRIFVAKDYKKKLIVRLDVAESILRRGSNGIWFEPILTAKGRE